jgi:hypothetical protein
MDTPSMSSVAPLRRWKNPLRPFSIPRNAVGYPEGSRLVGSTRRACPCVECSLQRHAIDRHLYREDASNQNGGDAANDGERAGNTWLVGQAAGKRHQREHNEQRPYKLADVYRGPVFGVGVFAERGGRVVRVRMSGVKESHHDLQDDTDDAHQSPDPQ